MTYRDDETAQRSRHDDLQRELARLEAKLAELGTVTAERARIIAELAQVRDDLAQRAERRGPVRLADLRVASPCRERWDDMIGDDRVRVCNGCDRPVFDLTEMTQEQAEAVLATRGVTPCVRFYRRADGTVMTADCAVGAKKKRRRLAIAAGAVAALAGAVGVAMWPEPPRPETAACDAAREGEDVAPIVEDDVDDEEALDIERHKTMGVMVRPGRLGEP